MTGLIEQLQVVAVDAQSEFHALVLWASLAVLAALLSYACCRLAIRAAKRYIDTTGRLGRVGQILAIAATFGLVLFGGVGTGYQFYFFSDSGVSDNGSFVNLYTGEIFASWTYQPQVENYTLMWSYSYKYDDDSEEQGPFDLPSCDVKDGFCTVYVPEIIGAKAITVNCYTLYVPPPVVHTNGTYEVRGVHDITNRIGSYVAPRLTIYADLTPLTPTNPPPVPSSVNLLETLNQEINQ